MDISDKAKQYIKENKKKLCTRFADLTVYPPNKNPSAFFMAGSPGAGKTEWSKSFIDTLIEKEPYRKIVRIDPDEIRESIPNYMPEKAELFQGATSLGVEKIMDHVFKYSQDFLLDGTFAHYEPSYKNIERSLRYSRKVGILYLYQDPIVAWEFTKIRAAIERRTIPKDAFINAFFTARENVNRIKQEFGKQVELSLIIKNFKEGKQGVEKTHFNIDKVDLFIKNDYNIHSLEDKLL